MKAERSYNFKIADNSVKAEFGRAVDKNRVSSNFIFGVVGVIFALGVGQASAIVRFDNYRGSVNVPPPVIEPSYVNYVNQNHAVQIQNLIDFAAGPSNNIASSGQDVNVDWSLDSNTLCNNGTGSTACVNKLQGRVVYALVKFPSAGTYYFGAAHDDEVKVEFSTTFSSMNPSDYRKYDYNVPVGGVGPWTNGDTSYDNIPGSFVVSQPGACYAMRIYWNNQGGVNFLRLGLRNSSPPNNPQAADYPPIPNDNLRDPEDPNSYTDCATVDTDLVINKIGPTNFRSGVRFDPSYTITLWNKGDNQASNATFADTIPSGLDVNGFQCRRFDRNNNELTGSDAQLKIVERDKAYSVTVGGILDVNSSEVAPTSGARVECTVDVTPNTDATSITNTATITVNDKNTTNNTSSWTSVREDVVSVRKTGPSSAIVNQAFVYELTVMNNSGVTKNGIVVADQLPSSMTATSVVASAGSVSCTNIGVAGALLECKFDDASPDFLPGENRVIRLTVSSSSTGSFINYAATNPNGSGNPQSNPGPLCDTKTTSCASAQTTLVNPPSLTLVKTVVGGTASVSDFPLTATGPSSISGISGDPSVTGAIVAPGTYAVSEQLNVKGYAATAWSCSINGATAVEGSNVTLANNQNAICSITNSAGLLTVEKVIDGAAFGSPTSFTFSVSCDNPTAIYSGQIDVAANATSGQAVVNIPAGSTGCVIAEDLTKRPSAPTNFSWAVPVYEQPSAEAIVAGGNSQGKITNSLIRGNILVPITKSVTGAPSAGAPGSYGFALACDTGTYADVIVLSGNATSGSKAVSVPQGSICSELKETSKPSAPNGYSWGTEKIDFPVGVITSASAGFITNPLNSPVLMVAKSVDKASVMKDSAVTYTIQISNSGSAQSGANTTVIDHVPEGLNVTTVKNGDGWVCTPNSGAGKLDIECVKASGVVAGSVNELVATIVATKTGASDVTNIASVTAGDSACQQTPAARCTSQVTVTNVVPTDPTSVPVDSRVMLILMGLLLVALATWQMKEKPRKG